MKAVVSIAEQGLRLLGRHGQLVAWYPVSTSFRGPGCEPGSHCTPTGRFRVWQKIGHGMPAGTVFRSRKVVGRWSGEDLEEDLILSRILWLDGMESANANTRERYIYIHGTNQEDRIGTPASHGCVRMSNADVIDLFRRLRVGSEVVILAEDGSSKLPGPPNLL
jgi:L,D-transpeptidase YbiS